MLLESSFFFRRRLLTTNSSAPSWKETFYSLEIMLLSVL